MITFRPRTHAITGEPVVEVFDDHRLIAAIYGRPGELKIVSKHLDQCKFDPTEPPAVTAVLKY